MPMDAWLTWSLDEITAREVQLGLGMLVLAGAVYCFAGYRIFRFILALTGFLFAGASAAFLAGWLAGGNLMVMVIAVVLGGICGAMALYFLYRTGVFFLGGTAAGLTAWQIFASRPEAWAPWAILGAGLAGGLIALLLERPVMTLATAAIGAWLLVCSLLLLLIDTRFGSWLNDPGNAVTVQRGVTAAWLALTAAGFFLQFAGLRRKKGGVPPARPA
jgi:hypothetical protein